MACLVSDVFHIYDMLQLSCVHIINYDVHDLFIYLS